MCDTYFFYYEVANICFHDKAPFLFNININKKINKKINKQIINKNNIMDTHMNTTTFFLP